MCVFLLLLLWLLSSGVSTMDHLPPSHHIPSIQPSACLPSLHPSIFSVLFLFYSCLSASYSSSFPHYPSSANVKTTSALLLSETLDLSCPSEVLISNAIHSSRSQHNIFSSAISSSASCLLVSATVSKPYIIAGLALV